MDEQPRLTRDAAAGDPAERRYLAQRDALIQLAGASHCSGDLAIDLHTVTELLASTLRVGRASLWRYTADRTAIECIDLYEAERRVHSSGAVLRHADYPAYFHAMATHDVIAASDARSDPRTAELTRDVTPLGTRAMLDAPFHVGATVEGVLCCEQVGAPRRWHADETTFVVAVAHAVSRMLEHAERRRWEGAVRLSVAALNAAADAIAVADVTGAILWANAGFRTLTDDPSSATTVSNLWTSVGHSDDERRRMRETVLNGDVWQSGTVRRFPDGRPYEGHITMTPVCEASGRVTHMVAIEADLTHQRSLEAQLLQAQKMEAVGQLAGGIAHDFNNLLTIIAGFAQLLADHATDGPSQQAAGEIVKAGARAAGLTRQLLAFSRHQRMAPEVVDLNARLDGCTRMLRRTIGADVDLQLHLQPGLRAVRIDPVQFEQVVVNIALNARAAMPHGGTFEIRTANLAAHDPAMPRPTGPEPVSGWVVVEFIDNGHGMSEDVKARLFEPFFSTKPRGTGTGLGLATAYGIVAQSGGHILVDSAPARGSTFRLVLPAAASAVAGTARPARAASGGGSETILVVEDEDAVRSLACTILRAHGYRVLEAAHAAAAHQVAAKFADRIDLLLSDVIMPGMNGARLFTELTAERPDLRALFMSGYPRDRDLRNIDLDRAVGFLPKPFTPSELLDSVRSALDGSGARQASHTAGQLTP